MSEILFKSEFDTLNESRSFHYLSEIFRIYFNTDIEKCFNKVMWSGQSKHKSKHYLFYEKYRNIGFIMSSVHNSYVEVIYGSLDNKIMYIDIATNIAHIYNISGHYYKDPILDQLSKMPADKNTPIVIDLGSRPITQAIVNDLIRKKCFYLLDHNHIVIYKKNNNSYNNYFSIQKLDDKIIINYKLYHYTYDISNPKLLNLCRSAFNHWKNYI